MQTLPLTPDVLVAAYANGIFPMDIDGTVQWFSPDPRAIIELDRFHASRNLQQLYRSGRFEIRIDRQLQEALDVVREKIASQANGVRQTRSPAGRG